MSSNQDSVRQFSIQRGVALCLGLFLCLTLALIITFTVSGMKRRDRHITKLQGEVASRNGLENTIKQYEEKQQKIDKEIQGVREMAKKVRRVLGIDPGQGILGQGGGNTTLEEVNADESISLIIETQPDLLSGSADFTASSLINRIVETKREITPIYEHVNNNEKAERARPWILPIMEDEISSYWFSSGFGNRTHPLTGKPQFHNGLDIAAPLKTPVIATADGVIDQITKDSFLGNMIQIEHTASQMKTLYGHLKSYADGLQVGQQVKRHDIIGYVGNSGRSTGTHLHYGVWAEGKWQNPRKYIVDHVSK